MSPFRSTAAGMFAAVPVLLGLVSLLFAGAPADSTPTPTAAPITVIIPSDSTPSPSPSSTSGGGGSTGGGSTGGGSGDGETDEEEAEGGGTNPDGSPIPPGTPKSNAPRLILDKDHAQAGEWLIATASGYQIGEKAQLVLYPGAIVIGSFVVGADGKFTARFRVPEDTRTGAAVVEVTGWESGYVTNADLMVTSGVSNANWLALWWVWIVLGVLLVALLSLTIAFRADIARWFGGSAQQAGA